MAIIYTYPSKTNPAATDLLLISDSEDENKTKRVTISDIRGATTSGVSSIIAGTENITLNPAAGTGDVTISVSGSSDAVIETVRNNSGATIEKGQPLHITGVSGITPTVEVADANDPAKMPVSGLANEQILNNANGEMLISGILEGIDTANIDGSPAEAAVLYVNTTTGGSIDFLSTNAPATEANLIQNIGIIVKNSPGTSGSIQVTAIGRTNATPNLNEGSLFIGNSSSQSTTLPIGNNTYVLGSNGTTASWGTTVGITTQPLTGTTRLEVGGLVRTNDGEPAEPAYSFTGNTNTGMYNTVSNELAFSVSGGTVLSMRAARIDSQQLHVFDATAGIRFGGSGTTLNSYEEGTWTPAAYVAAGSAPTVTGAVGTYIKIGDIVNCYFYMNVTSSSGFNVPMIIQGLPFTATNTNGNRGTVNMSRNDGTNFKQQQAVSGLVAGSQFTLKRLNITGTSLSGGGAITINDSDLVDASWYATAGLNYILEGTVIFKI